MDDYQMLAICFMGEA